MASWSEKHTRRASRTSSATRKTRPGVVRGPATPMRVFRAVLDTAREILLDALGFKATDVGP
jgi:hypothetical protein